MRHINLVPSETCTPATKIVKLIPQTIMRIYLDISWGRCDYIYTCASGAAGSGSHRWTYQRRRAEDAQDAAADSWSGKV